MSPAATTLLAECRASPVGITTGSPRWPAFRELRRAGLVELVRFGVRAWLIRVVAK